MLDQWTQNPDKTVETILKPIYTTLYPESLNSRILIARKALVVAKKTIDQYKEHKQKAMPKKKGKGQKDENQKPSLPILKLENLDWDFEKSKRTKHATIAVSGWLSQQDIVLDEWHHMRSFMKRSN